MKHTSVLKAFAWSLLAFAILHHLMTALGHPDEYSIQVVASSLLLMLVLTITFEGRAK